MVDESIIEAEKAEEDIMKESIGAASWCSDCYQRFMFHKRCTDNGWHSGFRELRT